MVMSTKEIIETLEGLEERLEEEAGYETEEVIALDEAIRILREGMT